MERMQVLNWKPRLSLFRFQKKKKKKKRLFSRDHQSLERKVVDKVVDKVVSSSSSFSRSDFFDARVNVRDDSLFLFVVVFLGKEKLLLRFFLCFFLVFFLLEKIMELEKGEKKRVKKTKSLHSFFSKEGRPRPTVYRHVSIHTQIIAFFKCAKVVSLSKKPLCRTKKKKRHCATTLREDDDQEEDCRRRALSLGVVVLCVDRKGEEEERKSPSSGLLFFFSFSRIFCVFPEVKNTTTRGGDRDKKSPKRSKKRERCATKATKTETDVRAENEKTRKEERSKKRQPKASAKTKSAVVSLESERREDRKKSGPTTKKVLSLGRLFDCFVGTLLSS